MNLFFIEKCIKHLDKNGELIFIVPRDFMKSTSAIKLNEWMYKIGTITDWCETGDKKIFKGACPNCVIFRFELDNHSHICNGNQIYDVKNGQIFIHDKNKDRSNFVAFSDLFFVKVGAVSGDDNKFISKNGNLELVCSKTAKTGQLKRMFYNIQDMELEKYKNDLINRKIAKFNENNWFMWGRKYYKTDLPRIYVNGKTRNNKPFFLSDCKAYDGSVLAIFPKNGNISIDELKNICEALNNIDWNSLGFKIDGRFIFSQKSLENSFIPWTR